MTSKEDIIRMAREAGFREPNPHDGYMGLAFNYRKGNDTGASLERFAELVRADEREACAKVCDELHPGLATKRAAEIIRARGTHEV